MVSACALFLLLLAGCKHAVQPTTEDLKWMCSNAPTCMEVCKAAAQQRSLAEQCQSLKQQALAARNAGVELGENGSVVVLSRSSVPLTPSQIAARSLRSIAVIETKEGLGTGFVVGPKRLATNLHVVAGADSFTVSFPGGEKPDSKDDDMQKIIAADKAARKRPSCAKVGCSIRIEYRYCD